VARDPQGQQNALLFNLSCAFAAASACFCASVVGGSPARKVLVAKASTIEDGRVGRKSIGEKSKRRVISGEKERDDGICGEASLPALA
jgi:hypothetical protein